MPSKVLKHMQKEKHILDGKMAAAHVLGDIDENILSNDSEKS